MASPFVDARTVGWRLMPLDLRGGYRISTRWSRGVHLCGISVSFTILSASLHLAR